MIARNFFILASSIAFGLTALSGVPASAASPPIVPGHETFPPGGTTSIGIGVDGNNQNAQLAESIGATLTPSWSVRPPLCPGAANDAPISVSVAGSVTVVVDRQFQCSFLSAYSTATGALLWRNSYHFAYQAVVNDSTIYLQRDDLVTSASLIQALSLSTGKTIWSSDYGSSTSPIVVGSGVVSVGQIVLDAATGVVRFDLGQLGSNATTLVSGGTVFVNSNTVVAAYSATSGRTLWRYTKPAPAFGGPGYGIARPSLHAGLLYITNTVQMPSATTVVLDPSNGRLVRTLPRSDRSLAFDGPIGFFVQLPSVDSSSIVSAVDLTTGAVRWTRTLPTDQTGPGVVWGTDLLVENGLVWAYGGSTSRTPGHLWALDEVSGSVVSTSIQPCAVAEGVVVAAQHRLFTPSDCGVLTYVDAGAGVPPTTPSELLPDPGFERGAGGWKAFKVGILTSVTSPRHGGAKALQVSATTATVNLVGLTQNTVVANSAAGRSYTASCWVRPTSSTLTVTIRLLEYPLDFSVSTHLGTVTRSLPAGTWTKVSVTGTAAKVGERIVPQIYSSNQTTKAGAIVFDDCSLT